MFLFTLKLIHKKETKINQMGCEGEEKKKSREILILRETHEKTFYTLFFFLLKDHCGQFVQ